MNEYMNKSAFEQYQKSFPILIVAFNCLDKYRYSAHCQQLGYFLREFYQVSGEFKS